ncbi:MAG TPA: hypothetical protein VJ063_19750 [Verrucomicrobiae bacterium]|nr:hypothetical protein [Verrucomicrobiae bacterium]
MKDNNIVPGACIKLFIYEVDEGIRRNIESRKQELVSLSGVARAWRRITIEAWAWRKALREVEIHQEI